MCQYDRYKTLPSLDRIRLVRKNLTETLRVAAAHFERRFEVLTMGYLDDKD